MSVYIPGFCSYGDYSSKNYGVNTLKFYFADFTIYFSYRTMVAFHHHSTGLVVALNEWSRTTGKHLNWIDGGDTEAKKKRVPHETLQKMFSEIQEG